MPERRSKVLTEQSQVATALNEFASQGVAHQVGVDILRDTTDGSDLKATRSGWTYHWGFIGELPTNKGGLLYLVLDQNLGVTLSVFEEAEEAERFVQGDGAPGVVSVSLTDRNGLECKIQEYDGVVLDLGGSQGEVLDALVKIRDSFRVAADKS